MAEEKVTILAVLVDKFSGPLKGMSSSVSKFGKAVVKTGKLVKGAFKGLSRGFAALKKQIFNLRNLIIAGLGAAIIKVFADFEDGLLQVGTLIDETEVKLEDLGRGVRRVGKETGDSLKSLNKGLFDIISAGVEATESIEALGIAARLGVGGGTTTESAAKGLVGILNAYNLEASQAVEVSDSLFTAMKGGITTIGRLADNIGKVAPLARTAGLSFDEMNAAVAVLTKSGLSTEESVTGLRAILNGILNPTEEATQLAAKLGLEFDTMALKTKGLTEFLTNLTTQTGRSEKILTALFPNIRAIGSVFALTADGASEFTNQMVEMGDKAGATQKAFETASESLSNQISRLRNTLFDLFIEVGAAAKPFIENIIERLRDAIQSVIDKRSQLRVVIESIGQSIQKVVEAIGTIFRTGDIIPFIVKFITATIQIAVRTFVAALPLLTKTFTLIGRKLGAAIVQGFFGATQEELARSFAGGSTRGKIGFGLFSNIVGQDAAEELKSIGNQLIRNENELAAVQARNRRRAQAGGTLSQQAIDAFAPARPSESALGRERASLLERLGGRGALREQLDRDSEAVKEEAKLFVEAAGEGIEDALRNLPSGLTNESQNAINEIFDIWGQSFQDRLAEGKEEDAIRLAAEAVARGAAEAAAGAAGEAGASVAKEVARTTVSVIDVALKETKPLLDQLKGSFEEFLIERNRIAGELEAGQLFRSEAGALNAENMARFNQEFMNVTETLNNFTMEAGEAAPVLEALFSDTREQMALMNEEVNQTTETNQSFFRGMENGLLGVIESFADLTQAGIAAGDLVGGALIDGVVETAFDAQASWQGFVSDFLQQISKLIAKALLAQAVLAGLKAVGIGGGFGFNQGGLAFASGGSVPGPNINRDIIPATLTPGEFVVKKDATSHYGAGVLRAINQMLVPKSLFAGLRTPNVSSVNLSGRFQEGGIAPETSTTPGVSLAVMVPDEQAADRFFTGGRGAFLSLLEENADTIRAILGAV